MNFQEIVANAKKLKIKERLKYIVDKVKNVDGFYQWFDENYKSKNFSIVVKVGDGFYFDLSQLIKL